MGWIGSRGESAAPAVAHNWLEVEGGAINDLEVDEVEDVRDHHELPLHISGRHCRDDRLLLDENARQIFSMIDDVAERVRIGKRLKDNENERLSAIEMLRELLDDNCQLTRFLRRRVESTSAMVFGRCLNSCREIHTCSSSKASEVERSRFASICDLRSASFCSVVAS